MKMQAMMCSASLKHIHTKVMFPKKHPPFVIVPTVVIILVNPSTAFAFHSSFTTIAIASELPITVANTISLFLPFDLICLLTL
jgi:hypothetical protein